MEWMQVLTIISAILFYTYAFYMTNRIKCIRKDMNRMDEKWERLFEKLLLKEQGK